MQFAYIIQHALKALVINRPVEWLAAFMVGVNAAYHQTIDK